MLLLLIAATAPVDASEVAAWGTMQGADVVGTLGLRLDPGGGPVEGTIEMTVRFDCRNKIREARYVLEISGRVEGDRIRGTAQHASREGLPKDELTQCKSAYETYSSRKDSRAFVGNIHADGLSASGTLGESGATVSWRATWAAAPEAPAPEMPTVEEAAADPAENTGGDE